jgi:hypothetical protein
MKRWLLIALTGIVLGFGLTGCSGGKTDSSQTLKTPPFILDRPASTEVIVKPSAQPAASVPPFFKTDQPNWVMGNLAKLTKLPGYTMRWVSGWFQKHPDSDASKH